MKICVVGAGSIGGFLGTKLHNAGHAVTLIARGAHLRAIEASGLRLLMNDGTEELAVGVNATDDMLEVGAQDVVILGLKAHQIAPVVLQIRALFGPNTIVLTTQNGIPWWYFQRHGGPFDGRVIESVDPGGRIAANIEAERIIGCIAYPAAEISRPGVIRHIEGTRFPVGELDRSESERLTMVSSMLEASGLQSPILKDFRSEVWLKLWGNLTFNPISALTQSTLVDICQFADTRKLAAAMMTEAQFVAHKLGVDFRVSLEKRIAGAERVGRHKTSMLQDVEARRALEVEAIIGAVAELGRWTETPTPYIDTVLALIRLLDHSIRAEGAAAGSGDSDPAPAAVPVDLLQTR